MDIDALTKKYVDEDPFWSIPILLKWLVEKKGIPQEIAQASLAETLLELDSGKNIPNHHEFDNYVLSKARNYVDKVHEMTAQVMKDNLNKKLVEHSSGNRFSKAWRALRGKL